MTSTHRTRWLKRVSVSLAVVTALAAPAAAQNFDLDALIAAAKGEPPLTIYDSTGKIVEMAENFAAKYGVEAVGQKVSANSQLEMIIRESQANNVLGDVAMITDTPAALAQLLPQAFVESWVPPDLAEHIPTGFQSPLAISNNANVWTYNTEVYDACPVSNIWELTEPNGRARWRSSIHSPRAPIPTGSTRWRPTARTHCGPPTRSISAPTW